MFHLIGFIIFGLIVGVIARALMPGRQHMSLLATSGLGMLGSLIAGYFGQAVGWYSPDEAGGFIASTIGAILLLAAYHFVMRNRSLPGSSSNAERDYPRKVA
jgi:uncharacterized membrane protein YeaQ/YmgE (transglycosylase-associated protein family)